MSKIAIIRIRGNMNLDNSEKDSLITLKLRGKNMAAVLEDSPSLQGVLTKIGHFITWGAVDDATAKKLDERKNSKGLISLNTPRRGYGRNGIKARFSRGGAHGPRGENMAELIERMI